MVTSTACPLTTKRIVIGQVIVCSGCCCGAVQRGKPEVPVDWLKQTWRSQGLLKNIQLTISCCLGPCDLPNVVRISLRPTIHGSATSRAWSSTLSSSTGPFKARRRAHFCLFPKAWMVSVSILFEPLRARVRGESDQTSRQQLATRLCERFNAR